MSFYLYNDPGLQAQDQISSALSCPKHFVAALILGITPLIGIIASFTLPTTALVQNIHTVLMLISCLKMIILGHIFPLEEIFLIVFLVLLTIP